MEKKYDHLSAEKTCQTLWEEHKTYEFNTDRTENIFSIDTPPPTVSGNLHIGHVFSYTHTDFIARYKRMRNQNVFYPMGFDDNGLPTERFVEKKHKTKAHFLGRAAFVELCQKEVINAHEIYSSLWKKLGVSVDWRFTYSTISDSAQALAQRDFITLYKKGLVYRSEKPALFCTTCQTSVAQAELEGIEQATTFTTITFKDAAENTYAIATTRPELLPACVAVLYHPEDERYTSLHNTTLTTPYFNKEVPCIADELVKKDKGTGLVMCCTFGDQTDIEWYQKHNLPLVKIIEKNGTLSSVAGPLQGLKVGEARKTILSLLEERGAITNKESLIHHVALHERCKQPIEYLVVPQWFVNILAHKEKFLALTEQIKWTPAFMKSRYIDWVKHLGWDWCISRQRLYGVPFPVWYCQSCNHTLLAPAQALPLDPATQSYPGEKCPHCESTDIKGEQDVMDTWNISSLTPQFLQEHSLAHNAVSFPFSFRPQAHDIIRTWAFYTIVKQYYATGSIPWSTIAISGHVTAGSEKISKSGKQGSLSPLQLLETYPADAIRYWAAKGRLGTDTAFSEEQIKMGCRLVTKLWNAFRFIKEHIGTHSHTPSELDTVNQWILYTLDVTTNRYCDAFDEYDHTSALEHIDSFFWNDFCDNYLEIVKDRFFNPDNYSQAVIDNTHYTLYTAGLAILKLYAPFVPHVTEMLYQTMYIAQETAPSLHIKRIKRPTKVPTPYACTIMEIVLTLISKVRKAKSTQQVSLKYPVSLTILTDDHSLQTHLSTQVSTLAGVIKAEAVIFDRKKEEWSEIKGETLFLGLTID